ncbi:hypothetical protein AMAG_15845 [Allomyces macrogynus ATCC 38327]|uniref:Uncharacterized protein n=1 Tax=Allomyces macrogynus (strain ATCC 38327) TaxID=578462 RepID=A0A0L0T9G0_ALLM3|nr:hypothetical protein AMAG_15845 [Allomyces macrogynus ATCC 38327]|eukprot:KNE71184.1 hypothetical protein AMAG_15845 [Allomyces macrogynus ATCC 38327]
MFTFIIEVIGMAGVVGVLLAIFVAVIWFLIAYQDVTVNSFAADMRIIIYLALFTSTLFSLFSYLRSWKRARTLCPHMLTTAIIGSILVTLGIDHIWPAGTTYRALRVVDVAVSQPYPCVPTMTTSRALIQWLVIFPIITIVAYLGQRFIMPRVRVLHELFWGSSMDSGNGGEVDANADWRGQQHTSEKANVEKAHVRDAGMAGGSTPGPSFDKIDRPSSSA